MIRKPQKGYLLYKYKFDWTILFRDKRIAFEIDLEMRY